MLYTYPDYYDEFSCVASECEDTCCAGWQIQIDDKSMEKYKEEHKDDGRIDWENEVFHHCDGKRCAFLNEMNLCDMYTQWGEKSLCVTCDRYPRHIEEFENVREFTLSLSCPEVAKIILSLKEKVTFIDKEDDEIEEDEDFDELMFSLLEDVRELLYNVLQNREISIKERISLVIKIAKECQKQVDDFNVFGINDVIYKYETKKINLKTDYDYYKKTLSRFKRLYDLEVLNDLWADMTDEAAALIYGEGNCLCNDLHKEFVMWLDSSIQDNNIMWEQILVYFISTYFCGAVYDGNIIGKVEMAVTSLVCIYEMLMTRWIKNDKQLDFDDIVFITYMYSRELEHSDLNLDTMEEVL